MPNPDSLAASAAAWAGSSLPAWIRGTLPHRLADRSRVVLLYLATRADWKTGRCDVLIGAAKVAEACGMCRRAAHDALEDLRASGWIADLSRTMAGTLYAVRHPDAPPLCADAKPARRRQAPRPRVAPAAATPPGPLPVAAKAKPKGARKCDVDALLVYYAARYLEARRVKAPIGPVEHRVAADLIRDYGAEVARRAIDGALSDPWAMGRASLAFVAKDPGRWAAPAWDTVVKQKAPPRDAPRYQDEPEADDLDPPVPIGSKEVH